MAETGEGGRVGDSQTQALADLACRSANSAQEASAASLGSAGNGVEPLSRPPCVAAHITEHSSAFEQAWQAHTPPASGKSADRPPVQTRQNVAVQCCSPGTARGTSQGPSTPSSTTDTGAGHSQPISLPDGPTNSAPCHSAGSDDGGQHFAATDALAAGHGASDAMHARKPPLAGPPITRGQQQRWGWSRLQKSGACQNQGEQKQPLVFLHGVGFGVLPYLGWVWKLLKAFPGALLYCISTLVCLYVVRHHDCSFHDMWHACSWQLQRIPPVTKVPHCRLNTNTKHGCVALCDFLHVCRSPLRAA